jgi:hypothetical protein
LNAKDLGFEMKLECMFPAVRATSNTCKATKINMKMQVDKLLMCCGRVTHLEGNEDVKMGISFDHECRGGVLKLRERKVDETGGNFMKFYKNMLKKSNRSLKRS